MSFSLSPGAASTFYDRRANLYGAPRVGIFKAETSHIPGNEAPVYLGIISPVDRFFLPAQKVLLLISLVSDRSVSLLFYHPTTSLFSPHFSSYNALFTRILLVDKFFLSRCTHRVSRAVRNGRLLPPYRGLREPGPVFRAHVSEPVKFRRRVVYRADEFALRGYRPFVVSDTWRRGDTYAESTQRDRPHLIPEVL